MVLRLSVWNQGSSQRGKKDLEVSGEGGSSRRSFGNLLDICCVALGGGVERGAIVLQSSRPDKLKVGLGTGRLRHGFQG